MVPFAEVLGVVGIRTVSWMALNITGRKVNQQTTECGKKEKNADLRQ
jgi:hypothetical protein